MARGTAGIVVEKRIEPDTDMHSILLNACQDLEPRIFGLPLINDQVQVQIQRLHARLAPPYAGGRAFPDFRLGIAR